VDEHAGIAVTGLTYLNW